MRTEPPALFDFMKPPLAPHRLRRAVFDWLAGKRRHFSFFIVVSFVAHLALFGMVALFGPQPDVPSDPKDARARDLQVFKESLQEYASDGRTPARLANALIALPEEDVEKAFSQAPVLDDRLTEREKAGLYKTMLAAATAEFTEGAGEGASALDLPLSRYFGGLREMPATVPGEEEKLVRIDNPVDESAQLFKLSKETAEAIESLSLPGSEVRGRSAEVNLADIEGRLSTVPGDYFYRESPYLQITAAGARLFYVIKGFPELPSNTGGDGVDGVGSEGARYGRPAEVIPESPTPAFAVIFMPKGTSRNVGSVAPASKPALTLTEKEAERVLDDLMTHPIVDQVRLFYRDYLEVYDPESPGLARLTGDFLYRNLGMVFVRAGDPLSRGFDLLEEVFYDNLSLDALVPHALRNPRSKTGAEILLGLAATYEFERRAIVALDGALDAAKLVLTDPANERFYVYNKNVKAYVVREVYQDLVAELRDRGYPALETVVQRYRDEQLRIYDVLEGMGGGARCRAQFARGRLYWDEGQTGPAMAIWMATDPAFADETLMQIRGAISERRNSREAVPRIDEILGRRAVAEKSELLARIAKFHKWDRR